MKQMVFILLIFCNFLEVGCFSKEQRKAPGVSQIQDIHGFIRIDGGLFTMGSPQKEIGRWSKGGPEDLRDIVIDSFYIAQYEVTQKEYFSIIKKEMPPTGNENLPINQINWFEAIEFCNKLSELCGLEPAYNIFYDKIKYKPFVIYNEEVVYWNKDANGYRLPTSSEWECAIRAGTKTPFYTGKTISINQANFGGDVFELNLMPIGSFEPNPWNLYDMAGNVYEWCWDWYPLGYKAAKIIRGGDSSSSMKDLRSAALSCSSPDNKSHGFRLARNACNAGVVPRTENAGVTDNKFEEKSHNEDK